MTEDPRLFRYDLPKELIAQQPLSNRIDARLMLVDRATRTIEHHHVRDLPDLLRSTDRLVLNDTRVVPAQLVGERTNTKGNWQGLFLGEDADRHWRIVCKTRGKLQSGETISLYDRDARVADKLWLLERIDDGQWLAHLDSDRPAIQALQQLGRVPLPPYIRSGQMVDSDFRNYQTVFAKHAGAVAAPTAGLHFTEELLRQLKNQGVGLTSLTLHVGMGTFKPISTPSIDDHPMHAEWCEVTQQAADEVTATREAGGRVIAVGTTCVRSLETAAAKSEGPLAAWSGETDLFIRPPYQFQAVDAMLTNFHFPATTLLLLVEALGGTDLIRQAYYEAIEQKYRFYSYGDAMLIV